MASSSLQRGDRLAASGQLEAALPHYDRAVSLQPSAAPARQRLCHALAQIGRTTEAIGCCTEALEATAATSATAAPRTSTGRAWC